VIGAIVCALTAKTSAAIEKGINSTAAVVDGHGSGKTYHLNFRTVDDADHGTTADVLKVSGVFTIVWSNIGDNG